MARLSCQELLMITTSRHARWLAASIAVAACMTAQSPARAGTASAPPGSAACVACHGTQGEGSATGAPRLAGQNAQFLERALTMFKAGTHTSPIMQSVASGLSDVEIHELATYFAGLHGTRVPAPQPPADLVLAGKELAQVGAMNDPTPPCVSCHRTDGHSDTARFPSLAGQPAAFVINRLHEFQARARANAPDPLTMTDVAAHLDEVQIRQVAAYLSTLPPQ
jgi:cytochrome c553